MTDRRKELQQEYREMKTAAGVYQIKNTVNGKVLVQATANLKTINGQRMQLRIGSHRNHALQAEWHQYGEAAFSFDVLATVGDDESTPLARQNTLKRLEQQWLDELQPYGERGYN